jgi:hypothetical protein
MSVEGATMGSEVLATLGDSLALCRWSVSASGVARGKFDVGAYEQERIHVTEVDAQGRRRREEFFAPDRLGDAVVRLYERYAELLPDGPARIRAAATARSASTMLGPFDLDRWATAIAPDTEVVDHRILGMSSGSGAEAVLRGLRAWLDVGADLALSVDDVLGLESGALLTRRTFLGTDRAGGGTFERPLIQFLVFGTDGLVPRLEVFEADRGDQALARFDELALSPEPRRRVEGMKAEPAALRFADRASSADRGIPAPPARRRVRANAASAHAARLSTASR